jgi:hypothetical protein
LEQERPDRLPGEDVMSKVELNHLAEPVEVLARQRAVQAVVGQQHLANCRTSVVLQQHRHRIARNQVDDQEDDDGCDE